jgi:hypothetical protein
MSYEYSGFCGVGIGFSGIGFSGIGFSGIGFSGIGFSAVGVGVGVGFLTGFFLSDSGFKQKS